MTASAASIRRFMMAGIAIALVVTLIVALQRIDLPRAAAELARVRAPWIVVALAAYLAILPLWAAQWHLLAPAGPRNRVRTMLGVVCMTSSVLNTTPLLVGEAAGVQLLSSVAGVDRAAGLAVLAMDQLLVGLAKLTVLAAAATILPIPPALRHGILALAAGVAVLALALLLVQVVPGVGDRWRVAHPRVAGALDRATHTLGALRSPRRGGGAFLLALAKKGCELVAIFAIQRAFGVELAAASTLLVLAALNIATLLPLVPGNLGVFEAAVVLAYAWLGVPAERALGMAVIQHLCYFVALALPGYVWLARGVPRRSRAATP